MCPKDFKVNFQHLYFRQHFIEHYLHQFHFICLIISFILVPNFINFQDLYLIFILN